MIFKVLLVAPLFLGLLAALLLARKSRPLANRDGSVIENHPKSEHALANVQFRVATFNVQTGKDLKGKRDITRAARVIANADVVGIQEVYAPSLFNIAGLGSSQTESLAAFKESGRNEPRNSVLESEIRKSFGWLFCATRRRWLREHRGNALLSKLLIDDWRIESLPDQSGKSYRNMTVARAYWLGEPFHIINTHLHTRQGREEQLEIVLREFAKYPRAILMGDFNSRASAPILNQALENTEISDAIRVAGIALENPDRIDWILTKGFDIHSGIVIEKGVSDHPYYEVRLSIKK